MAKGFRTLQVDPAAEALISTTFANNSLTIDKDEKSPAFIGTHVGLGVDGDTLLTTYADNSSGVSHIALHRMKVP